MKHKYLGLLLTAGLLIGLLSGCGKDPKPAPQPAPETAAAPETTAAPTVPATVPPDGNPDDVTCKGSYTAQLNGSGVAASIGEAQLTNSQLQAWYWAEVAQYRLGPMDVSPDFDRPLDTQPCPIDDSVASWQQYFLKRALNAWHSAQALALQGQAEGLPVEEAFQPNLKNYDEYMTGMPATKYLYRYEKSFQPNSMHQAYLDGIPQLLETLAADKGYTGAADLAQKAAGTSAEALEDYAELYNRGYMYFTSLSYYIETTPEEVEAYFAENEAAFAAEGITRGSGKYVDIRHILLVPQAAAPEEAASGETAPTGPVQTVSLDENGVVTCSDAAWEACRQRAEDLLSGWSAHTRTATEATFADMANKNSDDPGTAPNGGSYRNLREGQLIPQLDSWCFDESRQPGDTTIVRSDYGYHILYFSGATDIWYAEAEEALKAQRQGDLIAAAKEKYPAEMHYSAITLSEAVPGLSASDILYPDIAHQRFPEVPLYLQQDYGETMFGGYRLRTNGCGITSFAMLASYMTDTELTPPEMCARYGIRYSFVNGTDGTIFNKESPVLGFYLKEKTYEPPIAKAALEEGHIVISIQHKGYWTRGGHYIVLEKLNEDGTVQVRDSNIYNYGRIQSHINDRHTWGSITSAGSGYWIFDHKVTRIGACSRCGQPEGAGKSLLQSGYLCEKCAPALLRRNTYLNEL